MIKLKTKNNRLLILLLTIIVCLALAFNIGFIREKEVVYTHFFYIPVILAGMWYYRKAVYIALFLGMVHIFVSYISVHNLTINNLGRLTILLVVAYVIGLISQKRAEGETKLRKEKKISEKIVATVTDSLLVIDKNMKIKSANLTFYKTFKIDSEKIIGTCITGFLGDEDGRLGTELTALFETDGILENFELNYQSEKTGERVFNIIARGIIVAEEEEEEEEQLVVLQDITERKKAEESLIASKDYTESIIQNFLDTLIVVDEEATIQTVNPATCHLLGYTEKELIGQPVSIIFAEEEEEEVILLFQFFRNAKKVKDISKINTIRNRELTYRTKDGKLIPMSFNASVLTDEKGNVTNVVAGAKDITDLKHAEEELRKHRDHLEELVKERTNELNDNIKELERLNKLFVGREFRIKELRDEINELKNKNSDS